MGMCQYSQLIPCCYGMYHAGAAGQPKFRGVCNLCSDTACTKPPNHIRAFGWLHFQLLGRIALFQTSNRLCSPPDSECSHLSPSQRSPGNLFYPTGICSKSWTGESSNTGHPRENVCAAELWRRPAAAGESAPDLVVVCGSSPEGCRCSGGKLQLRRHSRCLSLHQSILNVIRLVRQLSSLTQYIPGEQTCASSLLLQANAGKSSGLCDDCEVHELIC
jgi:hypothetical protein